MKFIALTQYKSERDKNKTKFVRTKTKDKKRNSRKLAILTHQEQVL